jgi:uncharacterized protein YndB with AHSA1/START domain
MRSFNVPPLQITRYFDAPRAEVFRWWAEAEKLQQWSGCKQCVESEVEMDFRLGGEMRQNMKLSVNGRICDFLLTAIYEEIVVPERIRYVLDTGQQKINVLVEFFEHGATTKVIVTQDGFQSTESCQIISQGTNDSLDELHSLLAQPALTEPA